MQESCLWIAGRRLKDLKTLDYVYLARKALELCLEILKTCSKQTVNFKFLWNSIL